MTRPTQDEQNRHRDVMFSGSQTRYEQACERAARSFSRAAAIEREEAREATSGHLSFNGLVTFH